MGYGVVYIDACKDIGGMVAFAFEEAASIYKKMCSAENIAHQNPSCNICKGNLIMSWNKKWITWDCIEFKISSCESWKGGYMS